MWQYATASTPKLDADGLTQVKSLGYTAIKAQALTTPPYIFATIVCITVGVLSDRYKRRYIAIMSAYTLGLM